MKRVLGQLLFVFDERVHVYSDVRRCARIVPKRQSTVSVQENGDFVDVDQSASEIGRGRKASDLDSGVTLVQKVLELGLEVFQIYSTILGLVDGDNLPEEQVKIGPKWPDGSSGQTYLAESLSPREQVGVVFERRNKDQRWFAQVQSVQ